VFSLFQDKKHERIVSVLWVSLLAITMLVLMLPWTPEFNGTSPDGGLYAYVGKAIVDGKLPYRDVWEQKPPVGFYLNALAILLFGGTPWAIWWFNLLWLIVTIIVFFFVIKKMTGLFAASIASIVFILTMMVPDWFLGGNMMEYFALLPQTLVIYALYLFFTSGKNIWLALVGLFASLSFFTKQTAVGLGAAAFLVLIYLALRQGGWKNTLKASGYYLAGALVPLVIFVIYWGSQGAFNDFLDGVFLHSVAFVEQGGTTLKSIYSTFTIVFIKFPLNALYIMAVAAFAYHLAVNIGWLTPKSTLGKPPASEAAFLAVFLAMPIDIILAGAGGRNFLHYFVSCIPALAASVSYFLNRVTLQVQETKGRLTPWMASLLLMTLFIASIWFIQALVGERPSMEQLAGFPDILKQPDTRNDLEKYIIENSTPNDPVLVWHIHVGINFDTDRDPPTPYLFPENLFLSNGPGNKFSKFNEDIRRNPPKLIVIQKASSVGLPFVTAPDDKLCPGCNTSALEGMHQFKQFFEEHGYFEAAQIYDWIIYQRGN
jgi:4-amino-4-deoxy-L-arabinose transferase-like glycosyltransferase